MLKKIHHVGIVVRSIDAAYAFYRDTLSLPVHTADILQDQGVKAALLTIGTSEIELLEPIDPHTGVARFLARKGEGLHHLCFETDDIAHELEMAKNRGVALLDQYPRRGLAGLICFVHPKASHGVLVEYAQP
jgi:methylmalonyl-CoA/ethylmalonyl-CoA epimerase